jgi:BlaI family penicillinase repressor
MHLSDAEWTIMNAVWAGAPATAREVLDRVAETEWAYTTVKTMLDRLVEKGVLRAAPRGNALAFEPAVTRGQARRSALRSLLDRAFDGAFGSLVQHLVAEEKLSRKERQRLAELLAEAEQAPAPRGKKR